MTLDNAISAAPKGTGMKPTPQERIDAYLTALRATGVTHVRIRYRRGWYVVVGAFGIESRHRGSQIDDFTARLLARARAKEGLLI